MSNPNNYIYIGVGSNINPEYNIENALLLLQQEVNVLNSSTFYRTAAISHYEQPDYLNGVWQISTNLEPAELKFNILQSIETRLKRIRTFDKNAPRTIDLDILLYEDLTINEDNLQIPDKDILERAFIYLPLFELDSKLFIKKHNIAIKDLAINHHSDGSMHAELGFSNKLKQLILTN